MRGRMSNRDKDIPNIDFDSEDGELLGEVQPDAQILYESPRLRIMEKSVDGVQTYRVTDHLLGAFGKDYYDSLDVFHIMLAELVRVNPKAKSE